MEVDKLKQIFRQNVVTGTVRNESDAEHSWHLALMAVILSEYYPGENKNILKAVKMALIHDLVEIYAGDTFCYDENAHIDKEAREQRAAEKLFNMLPADQTGEMWSLWREFEEAGTAEARFAVCLDRLQPLLLNYYTNGHTWKKPGVTSEKVLKRNDIIRENMPELWEYVKEIIEESVRRGYLKP